MEFTGMALYTKEEIGRALEAYDQTVAHPKDLVSAKIKQAELDFEPTWLGKLLGVKTLVDMYKKSDARRSISYDRFVLESKFVSFTEDEVELLDKYSDKKLFCHKYENWVYGNEYWQVKNLYNGGKDCYLNPNQAAFVNRFKNKEKSQCQN